MLKKTLLLLVLAMVLPTMTIDFKGWFSSIKTDWSNLSDLKKAAFTTTFIFGGMAVGYKWYNKIQRNKRKVIDDQMRWVEEKAVDKYSQLLQQGKLKPGQNLEHEKIIYSDWERTLEVSVSESNKVVIWAGYGIYPPSHGGGRTTILKLVDDKIVKQFSDDSYDHR